MSTIILSADGVQRIRYQGSKGKWTNYRTGLTAVDSSFTDIKTPTTCKSGVNVLDVSSVTKIRIRTLSKSASATATLYVFAWDELLDANSAIGTNLEPTGLSMTATSYGNATDYYESNTEVLEVEGNRRIVIILQAVTNVDGSNPITIQVMGL